MIYSADPGLPSTSNDPQAVLDLISDPANPLANPESPIRLPEDAVLINGQDALAIHETPTGGQVNTPAALRTMTLPRVAVWGALIVGGVLLARTLWR